ncbi:SpoIVB peptidase S55 [Poriferisphaera corsica]|uniref:SpoIVB peptidase S55 n=1 Tax=Poriferisphaera corsica TaxID=2528020 RepID=A0A517YUG4_9BACT|nr:SpoIVB peptidase S55 domain-containing protein [Poriferisphaera corsica]QDU33874.1 SpoIVB peptidase S55 [Poriferisphaera corsica]
MDDHIKKHNYTIFTIFLCTFLLLSGVFTSNTFGQSTEATQNTPPPDALIRVPAKSQAIMPLDEVRIGMRGYGMTVFKGTKIEPFPVEVLSIIPDSQPKTASIWIKSDDPRLAQSGPVQGMSGSPIYLWDEGEEQVMGKGGRLIGAFAFGYSEVKYCLAGVQPIEYMRAVGGRIDEDQMQEESKLASGIEQSYRTIRTLSQLADARQLPASHLTTFDAISEITKSMLPDSLDDNTALTSTSQIESFGSKLNPQMMIPVSVGSMQNAKVFRPLLEPLGLMAVASSSGSMINSKPPPSINPADAIMQPGSTLSVSLAFGDMDMSGTGTCTDVLADGTVLGFGHAMFGQGALALPMSTGYVHFIVPRQSVSFKQASSLQIAGTLGNDENSAVAGIQASYYTTSPVNVSVKLPNQPERQYSYQVADHPALTPTLALITTLNSINAVQMLPIENTMYADVRMVFEGNRDLEVSLMLPSAQAMSMVFGVLPALSNMMQNPFDQLRLESMDVKINVVDEILAGRMLSARISKAEVAPGEEITVNFELQPYAESPRSYSAKLMVPIDTPEGNYQVAITNPRSYLSQKLATRPHLMKINNVDELYEMMKQTLDVQQNAVYIVMNLADKGIAIGREELPNLPSSKRTMLMSKTNTYATPYKEFVDTKIDTEFVPSGEFRFQVKVQKKPNEQP